MPSISTDTDSGAAVAYTYSADNETLIIDPHVFVTSETYVVRSNQSSGTFASNGEVLSDTWGVYFTGNDNALTNAAGSRIIGTQRGMSFEQDGNQVLNQGSIYGLTGQGIFLNAACSGNTITNQGYIYGREAGVAGYAYMAENRLINAGRIESAKYAVTADFTGSDMTIVNRLGAVLKGETAAVYTANGIIDLTNRGTVLGGIICTGSDTFFNHNDEIQNFGKISGPVFLGFGNDVFDGARGRVGKIFGEEGRDKITTGLGSNFIDGGAGKDVLHGGFGPARDTFAFTTELSATDNVDRIGDFQPNIDKISLDPGIFGLTSFPASRFYYMGQGTMTPQDRIIYNPANGWLSFDSNGSQPGGPGAIHFATIARNAAIDFADFIIPPL